MVEEFNRRILEYKCSSRVTLLGFEVLDLLKEELPESLAVEVVLFKLDLNLVRRTDLFLCLLDFLEEWVVQGFVY